MNSSSQRRRVEAEAENKAGYVRLVDEELRQLVGGQKLLLETELMNLLKTEGLIREVKGVVEVTVQTMNGGSFGVALEQGGTVADLKSEIQEAQGAALYRQQLFMLGEGAERGSEVQEPLSDNQEIKGSCTVMLCVQAEEEWSWDASSPLLERKVFEVRGPANAEELKRAGGRTTNNSIVTRIGPDEFRDQDHDEYWKNCMMVGAVMEAGTGKHTISMRVSTEKDGADILCGVVSDGAACDEDHAKKESTVGWFMYTCNGGLFGNGKFGEGDDQAGEIEPFYDWAVPIKPGDVLTMQVDTNAGTLKFWRNGKPHGPGYTSGVRGPLRWATSTGYVDDTIAIVPTPAALQQ